MFATKIMFNPNAQEVVDFKNSILVEGSSNGFGFNIYREAPHVSVDEDFMRLTPRCMIENLTKNKEGGSLSSWEPSSLLLRRALGGTLPVVMADQLYLNWGCIIVMFV